MGDVKMGFGGRFSAGAILSAAVNKRRIAGTVHQLRLGI
jgi:hypothetical protein